ncbi:heparin lyase I family protein [Actinomycetospora termitidis]|uniref:Heparin lyase I family protein n=1 Tax=Actinomycetospora termitidis TaxID=3053470 RepID=A0ABT7M2K3_9PSEU|nr:heparin lyase I family protein [Actinomycetospora sp. Odt1-22]MDL5154661.1 heparin lyase I family protein [Actinomycetospora sp. Odt1-22]
MGALALLVGVLTAGVAPGRAQAAVVTGRVADTAGGCLENSNNTAAPNNPQWLNVCGTNAGQQWSRYADGTLRVQNGCADTAGGATAVGTRVVLAACTSSTSQRWTFYAAGYVQNQKSGLCLAPLNNRIAAKVVITIAACANVAAMKWTVPALSTPTTTTPPPTTTTPRPTTTVPPTTTTTPRPTTTVPPTTTTAPPTTTPPGQTRQVWDSSFTSSGFGKFDDTPWNNVGASAPVIVNSPVTSGAKAARFTMPGGGTRTEIVPTTASFIEGQDRYFRFSFVLPAGFPTQVTSWQLLTQWKNDGTGSPPLELTVGNGNLNLSGGYGHPAGPRTFSKVLAPATTGQRVDLVVHILFSRDPGKGVVDVWRNGTQVLAGYKPAGGTLYPTSAASTATLSSYWKMGLYRDSAITQPAQYTIESAKIGNTYAEVAS